MAFEAKTGKDRHRSHVTDEALKELAKEELTGFHVQLPTVLHTAFKIKATVNGQKMKDAIIQMVQEYVEK